MSTQPPHDPILIIGAGLGGLALAHSLKAHDIPFQIFERDDSPLFRAQGYRIRIQDFYLKQLLPADLWAVLENCCGEFNPGGARIDAITGKPADGGGRRVGPPDGRRGGPPGPIMTEGNPMNVDRRVLRNVMIEFLMKEGDLLRFGKKFSRYEVVEDGVVAYFADGTNYKGRLLIGADGSRSLVRQQLLPNFKVYDTGARSIFGKTPVHDSIWDQIPKDIHRGMSIVSDTRDESSPIRVFCEVMRFTNRDKVDVDLPQDYLYWVMGLSGDKTGMDDQQFMHLSGEEPLSKTMDLTKDWDPLCQGIFRTRESDQVSTLAFAVSDPNMEDWKANPRVTVLGDAAHPMTPVGGVGANAAFQDATLMLQAIVAGGSLDDIAGYEQSMRDNARKYVSGSFQAAKMLFGVKPVEQLKPWTMWT